MEILTYIALIALTYFGITNFPIFLFMHLFPMAYIQSLGGGGPAIIISWAVWSLIDKFLWIPLMNMISIHRFYLLDNVLL